MPQAESKPGGNPSPHAYYVLSMLFLIVVTNLWGAFHGFMAAQRLAGDVARPGGLAASRAERAG